MPTIRTVCAGGFSIAGRRLPALCVMGLVAAAGVPGVIVSSPANAQGTAGSAQEVPIGTFRLGTPHDGFSIVEPPAGMPSAKRDAADDGSGSWFFQGWESAPPQGTSAEGLYDQAIKAVDAGRSADAQRLFERLIAEAPDSPRAAAARQHLGQIYRSAETEAGAAVARPMTAVPPARAATGGGNDAAAKGAAIHVSPVLSRATLHQARVSPAIDSQFLSDAGDRVFFSAGSAELGARARGVIQSQARFLVHYPELSAAIEGYADDGALPDDESLRLSQERALAVRDRLIAEGVDEERLVAYGRAREDRVSDCPAPECLAQNRRAVTILLNGRVDAGSQRRAQSGASDSATEPPTP